MMYAVVMKMRHVGYAALSLAIVAVVSKAHPYVEKKPLPFPVCRSVASLPDPVCSPGLIDPSCTVKDVCPKVNRQRPSGWYIEDLKKRQIGLYGYKDTDTSHYEEDHVIPMELCGEASAPSNLWPEFPRTPNPKDCVENCLHRHVCSGTLQLDTAQKAISSDWRMFSASCGCRR